MSKTDIELLEKFKKVEEKFLNELKATELDIDYSADSKVIVSSLKAYIKRVKNIEKILEEYESISNRIERLMDDDAKHQDVTSAVVDMREDSEELKAEIQSINGQVVVKKKKKKISSGLVKEF